MLRAAREAVNESTNSRIHLWNSNFRRARKRYAPMDFFRLPAFAGTSRHSRESMSSRKRGE